MAQYKTLNDVQYEMVNVDDMDYKSVKKSVFATCSIPDGCFGDRVLVGVAMVGFTVVFVSDHGYFRSPLPECTSQDEAVYLLHHHPSAKNIKVIADNLPCFDGEPCDKSDHNCNNCPWMISVNNF